MARNLLKYFSIAFAILVNADVLLAESSVVLKPDTIIQVDTQYVYITDTIVLQDTCYVIATNRVESKTSLNVIEEVFLSLLLGVLATFMALYLTYRLLRPRIELNKEFAKNTNGRLEFCFKNNSWYRIYNIRVFLKNVVSENGIDVVEENVDLEDVSIAHVVGQRDGIDSNRVICVNTKSKASKKMNHLRLIVSAQHALSGITEVQTCDYEYANAIQGSFEDWIIIPTQTRRRKVGEETKRTAK